MTSAERERFRKSEVENILLKREVKRMSARSDALLSAATAAEAKIDAQAQTIATLQGQAGEAAEDQAAMEKVTADLTAKAAA